jgi:hypothetical protein
MTPKSTGYLYACMHAIYTAKRPIHGLTIQYVFKRHFKTTCAEMYDFYPGQMHIAVGVQQLDPLVRLLDVSLLQQAYVRKMVKFCLARDFPYLYGHRICVLQG